MKSYHFIYLIFLFFSFPHITHCSLSDIDHIFILYLENWSFDGLFGLVPNVNGQSNAFTYNTNNPQVDHNGTVYTFLPQDNEGVTPVNQTNEPFSIDQLLNKELTIPSLDISHLFLSEQYQINGGLMNKFVAWCAGNGTSMSYVNITEHFYGKIAMKYTILDNFFHSAFGGSFLNHQWLISGRTPVWPNNNPPSSQYTIVNSAGFIDKPDDEKSLTPWPHYIYTQHYAVNTINSVNPPISPTPPGPSLPTLNYTTIGDTLSSAGITWKWYSQLYDDAMNNKTTKYTFSYHHQPFIYFANYQSEEQRQLHLKDQNDLLSDLQECNSPQVSFWKPSSVYNFHPTSSNFTASDENLRLVVEAIMNSCHWPKSAIIITHDENGGRWDHVSPPKGDIWGPGTRIPAVVIAPNVKQGCIDNTEYQTISITKMLEEKYNLPTILPKSRFVNSLSNVWSVCGQADYVPPPDLANNLVPAYSTIIGTVLGVFVGILVGILIGMIVQKKIKGLHV